MDGERPSPGAPGTCPECGFSLPAGTQRYCVECGADVVAPADAPADRTVRSRITLAPSPAARPARPTTWASGDFRAPAPTDGQGVTLPPPAPVEGVEWNGPREAPAPVEPSPVVPAPVEPVAAAPVAGAPVADAPVAGAPVAPRGAGWFRDAPGAPSTASEPGPDATPAAPAAAPERAPDAAPDADPTVRTPSPGWPADPAAVEELLSFSPHRPVGAGPIRLEIAYPPDPVEDTDGLGRPAVPPLRWADPGAARPAGPAARPAYPGPAPDAPGPAGGASAWYQRGTPAARTAPADGAWRGAYPGPVPGGRGSGNRLLPLALAAVLVLVVVSGGVVWWLRSRPSDDLRSAPVSVAASTPPSTPATTPAPAPVTPVPSVQGTTVSAPGDVTPGAPTPSPSADPAVFTHAMDGLLDQSASARVSVSSTVAALQTCHTNAAKAATSLRAAGKARSALGDRAAALDATAVPGGADAVTAFVTMQRASAQADEYFASWADEVAAAGCHGSAPHSFKWSLGTQQSGDATVAKNQFVALWNPIAAAHGLRPRATDGL